MARILVDPRVGFRSEPTSNVVSLCGLIHATTPPHRKATVERLSNHINQFVRKQHALHVALRTSNRGIERGGERRERGEVVRAR